MAEPPVLPSWRYHVSGESRVITTAEELQALAAGEWFESPAEAADAAAARASATAPAEESPSPPRSRR